MNPLFLLLFVFTAVIAIPLLIAGGSVRFTLSERQPGRARLGLRYFLAIALATGLLAAASAGGHIAQGNVGTEMEGLWIIDGLLEILEFPIVPLLRLIDEEIPVSVNCAAHVQNCVVLAYACSAVHRYRKGRK